MIPNSFPHTQGPLSREQYLTLILLGLIEQAGGDLHVSAQALEAVDSSGTLLTDWDSKAQQLILRSGSRALVVVEVRGAGWMKNAAVEPPQPGSLPPSPPPDSKHRSPLTEEDMLTAIRAYNSRQAMRQWREQGASAVAGMPEPEEPPFNP